MGDHPFRLSGHLSAPVPRTPSEEWLASPTPTGWRAVRSALVYVHEATGRLIVEASPGELWPDDGVTDGPHNCDAMGCRAAHVIAHAVLEAPPHGRAEVSDG